MNDGAKAFGNSRVARAGVPGICEPDLERFIRHENFVDTESTQKKAAAASIPVAAEKNESPSKAVANIARSIEDSDDYGWVNLASMDSRILGAAPDLDSRTYSCRTGSEVDSQGRHGSAT